MHVLHIAPSVIAPSVSVILLVSATLAIALICGTAHICTKRKRMALRYIKCMHDCAKRF